MPLVQNRSCTHGLWHVYSSCESTCYCRRCIGSDMWIFSVHRGVNIWTKTVDGLLALLGTEIPFFVLQWGICIKSLSRCVTYNILFMKCRKLMSTARSIHYIRFKPRKRELYRFLQDIWTPKETFWPVLQDFQSPSDHFDYLDLALHRLPMATWFDLLAKQISNYTNRTGNLS